MRIALCNEVIAVLPFERQCAFARAIGYDGLEIAPFTIGDEPHLLPPQRRAAIRRAAADNGIAISGLHYLMLAPSGLSITSTDAAQRAPSVEVMRRLCDLAADLGARVVVHGLPAQRRLEPGNEAEGRMWGAECLAAVADAAAAAGTISCIEPLAGPHNAFVTTIAEAAQVVRAIGSPAVKTMIDCSAAARGEEEPIPEPLRRWLPSGLIAHIHCNDPNRRGPGEGTLRFAPMLRALAEGGYRGIAAVEPLSMSPTALRVRLATCAAQRK